jgi:Ca-activated chloride channel family protein
VLMEQLANNGDGYYSYVDNIQEAYRVFVENLNGSLQTIAKDVKVQVDFNPDTVSQYRLLGYENRDIKDEDFRNDSVDAGEVGINTSVTALYEVEVKNNVDTRNIAEVFLRYRDSDDLNQVKEFKKAISGEQTNNNFSTASASFKLAASVALYAEILRKSYWARDGRFSDVLRIAREARNGFENTEKIDEFINLVEKAARLQQIID